MLGKDLSLALKNEKIDFVSLSKDSLNIQNLEKIKFVINEHRPDVVINCAAYTKVDMAEVEKEKALSVNAAGVYNLAKVCKNEGIKLVHISTDYVFSGEKKSPYHPFDQPDPINVYGISKLYGEHLLRHSGCDYLIIRTSWLYGPHGENFVQKMLQLSEEKSSIDVVNDQFGSPTSTHTLSKYLVMMVKKNISGLFHLTDRTGNGISWFTFAKKIMEVFERDTVINPVLSDKFIRPAKRPKYSVLDIEVTELVLGEKLPYWEISLGEYKKRVKY